MSDNEKYQESSIWGQRGRNRGTLSHGRSHTKAFEQSPEGPESRMRVGERECFMQREKQVYMP